MILGCLLLSRRVVRALKFSLRTGQLGVPEKCTVVRPSFHGPSPRGSVSRLLRAGPVLSGGSF